MPTANVSGRHSRGRYPTTIELRTTLTSRPLKAIALAVVLVAAGCCLYLAGERLAGGLAIVVFGLSTIFLLWRNGTHRVALRLTADGLENLSTAVSFGLLPWSEVLAAVPVALPIGEEGVAIGVRHPDAILAQLGSASRAVAKTNMDYFNPPTPVWLSVQGLPLDAPQVAALINDYLAGWKHSQPASPRL